MTIQTLWNTALAAHSELPALSWVGTPPWTYAELGVRVRRLIHQWQERGLVAGDRVALWTANAPAWGAVYLSVTTSGRVIVPILPDFSWTDTTNVLLHCEAKILVMGTGQRAAWEQGLAQASEERRNALSALTVLDLETLVDTAGPEASPSGTVAEDDLAALIYTSGTTGASKGVMLSHGNIASNASAAVRIPGYERGDKQLSVLPLAHTYECTLGLLIPLMAGVHIHYLDKPAAPTVLLPALAEVRPHAMLTVPLLMEKIYRAKIAPTLEHGVVGLLSRIPVIGTLLIRVAGKKLEATFGGRLKFFGIGGAPLAPEVARFLHRARFPYAIGYGLTETSPLVAGHLGGRLFSTGRPLTGVEVKILEPFNAEGAGEVAVRGPNVMQGYYHDTVRTAEVIDAEGWFHTGDLGQFDRHGHLHLKGRLKNVILGASGENIYPEAIEAMLNGAEGVLESLVLQRSGQLIALVHSDQPLDVEKLRTQVNPHLARFSRLSAIEQHEQPFEKTATLKIKRYLYK